MPRVATSIPALLLSFGLFAGPPALAEDNAVAPLPVSAEMLAAPVLSAEAQALKDAIDAGGEDLAPLAAVYEQHGFQDLWTPKRAQALLLALSKADDHGLPIQRYAPAEVATKTGVDREIAFSRAFLTYARDINSGLLEPRSADRDIVVAPKRPDPMALLEGIFEAPDAAEYLDALQPTHPDYAVLLAEKIRLEEMVRANVWGDPVPAGRTLRLGDSGPRVAQVRARLGLIEGIDLGDDELFDEPLAEAVRAFQRRKSLADDAVIGPNTFAALNTQPDGKLRQVLVNLERQRWLNYDRGSRHIMVNQADFSVRLIDGAETTLFSRAVIGKVRHKTQEFNDEMTHLVINPTWHVPRSIATQEMLPRLRRNPRALGGSMRIMTRNGTVVNPAYVDFSKFSRSSFPFIIKQRPGPNNALGRVKFMFPNDFNIYLHDTPAKKLFNRDVRAYSHGCVRVHKPFELAYALLAPQVEDPKGTFDSILNTGRERQVDLDKPVPIYLTYWTAFVDDAGEVQYRGDIYGRDARVFAALANAGVQLGAVEG